MADAGILKSYKDATKVLAQNNPIGNAVLEREADDIKNTYFKMLVELLLQKESVSERQLFFLNRLVEGVATKCSMDDYLSQALELKSEECINFSSVCKEKSLKYRLALDGMVLLGVEERSKDNYKLLAAFCKALVITKEEMDYLAAVARAILKLDEKEYVEAESKAVTTVPAEVRGEYFSMISPSHVCGNKDLTIFYPAEKSNVAVKTLESIIRKSSPSIKLINVTVDLSEYDKDKSKEEKHLEFSEKKTVILEGCHFIGGDQHTIIFKGCKEIIVRDCIFEKFTGRTMKIMSSSHEESPFMEIVNSKFLECTYIYYNSLERDFKRNDEGEVGGVIWFGKECGIYLDSCIFEKCGAQSLGLESGTGYKGIIANGTCAVNRCQFIQCLNYRKKISFSSSDSIEVIGREEDYELFGLGLAVKGIRIGVSTLFGKGTQAVKCVCQDSAVFCD